MPTIIVVGAQWGDEGKGRVVDNLADQVDLVARYNGGDNAGHTVVAEGHTLRLHLVPSGILHPHTTCLIGNGVVVNPTQLLEELDELEALGVDVGPERVKLAAAAHIILPTHRALDGARERARGEEAIGTTRRGIGPVYSDKASRIGLRAHQMSDPEAFADEVVENVKSHNRLLEEYYGLEPLDVDEAAKAYHGYAQRLKDYLVDGSGLVAEALGADQTILCEGAQGTLLDLDHGTYPYVTSSSATAGGAMTGLGFGPREVERVIGVAKAYTTRVGEGPFPTELLGEVGQRIREAGGEYGTTTGRPRRCGWLDLNILRYAAQVNGLTEVVLTKLDVLTGVSPLRVAVAYEHKGKRTERLPIQHGIDEMARWEPVYEELPGWDEDIQNVRERENLPPEAKDYVALIEQEVGLPIPLIGVGPDREEAIGQL